jgi:hypothetical protein
MGRNDDLLNMVLSAARYAFSNLGSLLIGGIVIALSFLVIGLPFFLGYITRCMKEIVKGNGVMPEWDDIGLMFVDGIRMTGVFFVYLLIYVLIILVPAVPVIIFNLMNVPILALISTVVLAVTAAIVAFLLAIAFFGSWIIYANTGSVRKAITVRKIFEFVSSDPHRYLEAMLASGAVALAGALSMTLFVTIPWALFVICAAMTYIYAKFYQDTMKSTSHALDWK